MKQGHRFSKLAVGKRRKRGEMNENERAYANELTADPNVFDWKFEPLSFRLTHPTTGKPTTYCPDFLVLMQNGDIYFDDCKPNKKGIENEASLVRIKVAAEIFACFTFRLVRRLNAKQGGGWERTEV